MLVPVEVDVVVVDVASGFGEPPAPPEPPTPGSAPAPVPPEPPRPDVVDGLPAAPPEPMGCSSPWAHATVTVATMHEQAMATWSRSIARSYHSYDCTAPKIRSTRRSSSGVENGFSRIAPAALGMASGA